MACYMCSLPICRNRKVKDFGVFKIPTHEPTCSRWLRFLIDNGKRDPQMGKVYRLCEQHFDPSDIVMVGTKKCLKKGSVPIFGVQEAELEEITEAQIQVLKEERKRFVCVCDFAFKFRKTVKFTFHKNSNFLREIIEFLTNANGF
jgi:THAP domain